MLEASPLVAFAATCDAVRSRLFYEQTLGLPLVSDEPYALAFDANGTVLRVQKLVEVGAFKPQPFTVLGWTVANIVATVRALAERSVHFERYPGMDQDALGIWSSPSGARVAWFKDPDGNVLSLTQLQAPTADV